MSIIDEMIVATPVIGQAKGFIKVARNVTNATSVSSTAVERVKTIVAGSLSNPALAPFSFSILIGTGTQILEELL